MKPFTKKDLKECIGLNTQSPSHTVNLEVEYKKSGTVRAYINQGSTPFYAGGHGYDKYGTVVAQFINYWVGECVIRDGACGIEGFIDVLVEHNITINTISTLRGAIYQISKGK